MANFRRNIRDFWNFIKKFLFVPIFEKLYIKSLFALEEIEQFAMTNQKTLEKININEKTKLMKGLEYISEYNQDFKDLRVQYMIKSTRPVSFSQFQSFLRKEESGFYFKKAIVKFIFKVVLALLQLSILICYYPKHFCVNELIYDNSIDDDTMFWIYDNQKYKVKKDYNERLFYLRIIKKIIN